ncbi:MAG TPA: cysteine desulfurase family protein [Myxococcota bacterium]|nr:cysteine desulfurase family protein [Myxococcota bacterium]
MTRRPIYLDHHATTPVDPRVVAAMAPYWTEEFGNASSATHLYGWRAEAAVEQAREELAAAIGAADPREIVFTSGTTESDNLALAGIARAQRGRRDHIVTTAIEHPAVLDTARALAEDGCSVTELPVGEGGLVDPEAVRAAIGERTALVSIGAANSEIGTLQPLAQIAEVCRAAGVPFHSDAAQAVGKVSIDVRRDRIDLLSFCAHKLYGPKGIGALYVRRGRPPLALAPLLHGGGHERGLRSGTTPVPLVVGFARAVSLCVADLESESARLCALRDRLFDGLCRELPGRVAQNGDPVRRLPGNLNASFAGARADGLLTALHDVALSTGSACASARGEPSHVLRALGLPPERIRGALRFGLGRGTTEAEIDTVIARVAEEVRSARADTGPLRVRTS